MEKKLYTITKHGLNRIVSGLIADEITVLGPVSENNGFVFRKIEKPEEIRLDYDRSYFSPIKEYLLPSREKLLDFDGKEYHSNLESEFTVLFGVHPYDIKAMEILDALYLNGQHVDPNYWVRRGNMILVGLDVTNPAKGSFSASADTHTIETGFDLILTDIGNDLFVAEVGTRTGERLLLEFAYGEFRKARKNEILKRTRARAETAKKYPATLNSAFEKLAELLETEAGKAWLIEAAKICKECGNCTKVCPTCVCYTKHHCPHLDGTGEVIRERSSCLFEDSAKCGGGHNFRPTGESRIKNRLLDKVKFISQEYGIKGCVGCGRCEVVCPFNLSGIASIFNALTQEEK